MSFGQALWRSFAMLTLLGAATLGGALLFSLLAPWSPLADSMAHFRLHLLVLFAAAVPFLWLTRQRAAALAASLLAFAFLGFGLRPAFPGGALATGAAEVSFLQFNLLFRNNDHASVLALIAKQRPDAIALQEVSGRNRRLLNALLKDYPHQNFCRFASVGGVAVLSKFPPTRSHARGCAGERGLAWMRVKGPKGPLTLASLHLHWPYPYRQGAQLDFLTPHLRSLPRPVLLGGDFNAAPWSHAVDRVAKASGTLAQPGLRFSFHFTWRGRELPIGMPIDHVLADPGLQPRSLTVAAPAGSDHRAVIARLGWKKQSTPLAYPDAGR